LDNDLDFPNFIVTVDALEFIIFFFTQLDFYINHVPDIELNVVKYADKHRKYGLKL